MSIFDRLRAGLETTSAEETHLLAREFAAALPSDRVLALSGDLGAGKTTFVRGLAAEWKIPGPITSPTFTLVNIHQGDRTLVHVDAYRLETPSAIDALMIEDFLRSPWCLAVEWPENTGDWIPPSAFNLQLALLPSGHHTLRLME
ncbi:MAG: tRNA (adenosine(37)-N6)-threonylcarbamoyltransferase complex ATPase subunit type 1 TsaE [Opitutaceae bacterium]